MHRLCSFLIFGEIRGDFFWKFQVKKIREQNFGSQNKKPLYWPLWSAKVGYGKVQTEVTKRKLGEVTLFGLIVSHNDSWDFNPRHPHIPRRQRCDGYQVRAKNKCLHVVILSDIKDHCAWVQCFWSRNWVVLTTFEQFPPRSGDFLVVSVISLSIFPKSHRTAAIIFFEEKKLK